MITVTSVQLEAWLAVLLWPFLRIAALLVSEPLLGHRAIPLRARLAFALVLAWLLAPVLPSPPPVGLASAQGLLIAVQQILIGLSLGFAMRLVLAAVEMAGAIAGLSMGLGFALFYDPQNSAQVPVLGQFMGLLAILVFFAINGHLMVIAALVESFRILPISAVPLAAGGFQALAMAGGQLFVVGVMLSLPVLAALLIVNVAMGVMSRAAPQLNLFAVGFPLTLMAGFAVLLLALPHFGPHFVRLYEDGLNMSMSFLAALAGKR
ncbi:flagellar biosynthetic protein FliR [Thiobacter aerophilum]|uniref:Flagellar biosynthetic protein FliR n=1 Tax=Thiobacter aerophilum TaxID=3121275 RepID=A0ABV0EB09_9BURK